MITERDEINIRRTAEQKARAEGRKEGLYEVIRRMLSSGMSVSDVSRHTGLSEAEIEALSVQDEDSFVWQCPKFCVNDILSGRVIVEFYNPILFSNIAIN